MGYETRYSLEIQDADNRQFSAQSSDIIAELRQAEYLEFALDDDGSCRNSCKWYEHEEDLRAFSKRYPDKLFVLNGEGEEPKDLWRKYFLAGQCQAVKAKIEFPEFDADLLT